MWSGFDPELQRQLETLKQMFALTRQTPSREWPLAVVREHDALLVIREWPDGTTTAYLMTIGGAGSALASSSSFGATG
jgi:hypothetical protein